MGMAEGNSLRSPVREAGVSAAAVSTTACATSRFDSLETRALTSGTNRVAVCTNGFHGLASASGIHLLQNSVDVVSHGELRKTQARSDFFISQTFRHEADELLLPQRKIRPWSRALDGDFPNRVRNELEQSEAKFRRANRFASKDGAHRGNNVRSRSILQQIACHTGTDGSHELIFI